MRRTPCEKCAARLCIRCCMSASARAARCAGLQVGRVIDSKACTRSTVTIVSMVDAQLVMLSVAANRTRFVCCDSRRVECLMGA